MTTDLTGSTALITGATSGIGKATADQLAALGAHVIVSGRDKARGDAVVAGIRAAGGTADFVAADLGDEHSVRELAARATEVGGGHVDILVNSGGIFPFGATADTAAEPIDEVFAVNVKAPYLLVAALAPAMAERGHGAIVNVTTMVAEFGMNGMGLYGSSKAALVLLTKSWAAEFGPAGVRVNAVSPGPTRTEGTDPDGRRAGPARRGRTGRARRTARRDRRRHRLPRHRSGQLHPRRACCPSTAAASPSDPAMAVSAVVRTRRNCGAEGTRTPDPLDAKSWHRGLCRSFAPFCRHSRSMRVGAGRCCCWQNCWHRNRRTGLLRPDRVHLFMLSVLPRRGENRIPQLHPSEPVSFGRTDRLPARTGLAVGDHRRSTSRIRPGVRETAMVGSFRQGEGGVGGLSWEGVCDRLDPGRVP